ncbi:methylmalonyl-CoA mutase [Kordiimonas sediminis]|uniref:Methylmalonyl-CoA mutase n=1 Tax=Kordiimonas sediminis TaxID=1735581 RepID=A0A919AW59_9PROT|nr:methylmalonyl-CoA mutase family protein [Kordiimonas sediminis]GHF28909.1 methylmalonyl-CoA mutase [Kordiimonas sediminis]
MADDQLVLAGEFEAASHDAWLALVEKTLKGKSYDKAMISRTYDDVPIQSLYTRDMAKISPQGAMPEGAWDLCVPHWSDDPVLVNDQLLEDLAKGATSAVIRMRAGNQPGLDAASLQRALDGVYLDMCGVSLVPGEEWEHVSRSYLQILNDRKVPSGVATGCLGVDPLGTLASTGRLLQTAEKDIADAAALAKDVHAGYPALRAFMVDVQPYNSAGGTEVLELSAMLSTGVAYLRAMEKEGMSLQQAFGSVAFTLSVDADLYMTIAKLRAARRLWATVADSCNCADAAMELNAVTSLRMMTKKDPWVNILRATASSMAAGIGGASSLTIVPHDALLGVPSDFARRIARNIQIICMEESGLANVADAAAGSYAFETLTTELSEKAWEAFQKAESEGGILASLRAGRLQGSAAQTWQKRQVNLARRKDPITGVSEFPDIHESSLKGLLALPAANDPQKDAGESVTPLGNHRLAEDFEHLRLQSDKILAQSGVRPSIVLATIGPVAEYTARATFAKNFFEAGGIETVQVVDIKEVPQLSEKFKEIKSCISVICGSDDRYEQEAENLASLLRKGGCKRVYLAGKMDVPGVDECIYMGCNLLDVIEGAYDALGEMS